MPIRAQFETEDAFREALRDYFAGQALSNADICTGTATDYELRAWFGGRGGIRTSEILAYQAYMYADALLAAHKGAR